MRKKIIDAKVSPEHYKEAPCIMWCFDDRFDGLWQELKMRLREQGFSHIDQVKLAGGAKDLASPEEEGKRMTALWEIEASLKLHKAPWIGLMVHADCAAYGKKFTSEEEEFAFYETELRNAKELLKEAGFNMLLKLYYADFTGLHEVL